MTRTDVTRPRNLVRRINFDAKGYITQETHTFGTPLAQTWTSIPVRPEPTSCCQRLIRSVVRTDYAYDTNGNRLTKTSLAGTANAVTETWTYTPTFNQVATFKNGLNYITTFTYDTLGLLREVKDPLNNITTFTYNSAGQPLTVKDPRNKITTLTYDLFDLRSSKDSLNRTTTFQTDALGRRTLTVDPMGHRTYVEYDVMDRVAKATDAQGRVTTMTYDGVGNLTGVKDARNNTRTFTYDPRHRVATAKDALLRTDSYMLDHAGNLTSFTDRKGQVTIFTYDSQNRRSQATYHNSTKTKWTYDAGNRVTLDRGTMIAPTRCYRRSARSWDGLDRLTQEVTPQGTITYAYDKAHRRTTQTVTGQPMLVYTYDNLSRLDAVSARRWAHHHLRL